MLPVIHNVVHFLALFDLIAWAFLGALTLDTSEDEDDTDDDDDDPGPPGVTYEYTA